MDLEGAIVTACDNGASALKQLRDNDFDVLISDIGMPGMDGYQLINEVRSGERNRDVPAIALTGFGRAGDTQRAMSVGFNAHLPKPTSIDDLKAMLTSMGIRGSDH